tara:strand:- start:647 stop:988 length:342 start_codon:yes stop_codon:yes gene_type:complete
MKPEEEVLQKIKHVLSVGNESQAIRLIEQYGEFKQEESKQFSLNAVGCSTFFKVKFAYDLSKQGRSNWRVDEKIFDVKNANELDVKIKKYISECSNRNVDRWYYMSKTSIEKL